MRTRRKFTESLLIFTCRTSRTACASSLNTGERTPEREFRSRDTMPVGKIVKRFKYPDGRLTAMICIDECWKVEVFSSDEAVEEFAKQNDLTLEEMRRDEDSGA